jgi:hypothetical protein
MPSNSPPASVWRRYWLPSACLQKAEAGATQAQVIEIARANTAWLARWLPIYLLRWALLFVACEVVFELLGDLARLLPVNGIRALLLFVIGRLAGQLFLAHSGLRKH